MTLVVFALENEARDYRRWLKNHPSSIRIEIIGVGAHAVKRNLPPLLAKHQPERIVCAGYAGALASEWKIGDVFCATNFSTIQPTNVRGAVLHSSSIALLADHDRVARETQASCIDMESATVTELAGTIPLLVLRAISDTPEFPIPIPFEVTFDLERQKIQSSSILLWLLTHPSRWKDFGRFLRNLRAARKALTKALIEMDF